MNPDSRSIPARNIVFKPFRKVFPVRGAEMEVVVEDARYAVTAETPEGTLLDGPLVEQMMRGIAAAVAHNTSRYNPAPKQIVISRGSAGGGEELAPAEMPANAAAAAGRNRNQESLHAGGPSVEERENAPSSGMSETCEPRWP